MSAFLLNISSPDGNIFSGNAERITLRGSEGDFAVLAGHIPFITSVKKGECAVHLEDGSIRRGHTEGGLLTVGKEEVTFLTAGLSFED